MSDAITKVRILWALLLATHDEWVKNVWEKDLDSYDCCSGGSSSVNVCGCYGLTVRDIYANYLKKREEKGSDE